MMAQQKHLPRAPIKEALVDIRTLLTKDFPPDSLEKIGDKFSSKYAKKKEKRGFRSQQEFREGKPLVHPLEDLGIQGYFFSSPDEKSISQFRLDGFTYNRLEPYSSWEDVINEVQNLWPSYRAAVKPLAITRIAVRYINFLLFPIPFSDFSEYLEVDPKVPQALPQVLSSFFNRVCIHDSGQDISANVTQSFDGMQNSKNATIILDIEVYKSLEGTVDDQEIWKILEILRVMKNKIFFSYITEKTARLFE